MDEKKPRKKRGEKRGPKTPFIDEAKIEQMASEGCTVKEIADVMQVNRDTIYDKYAHLLERGRSKGHYSIKRRMFEKAMSGDTTMLVWLSKVYFGWREAKEETPPANFNVIVYDVPKEIPTTIEIPKEQIEQKKVKKPFDIDTRSGPPEEAPDHFIRGYGYNGTKIKRDKRFGKLKEGKDG